MNRIIYNMRVRASLSLLCLSVLILSGCNGHSLQGRDDGVRFANQGDWDQSVQYYQKKLNEDPGNAELKMKLARSRVEASIIHMARGETLLQEKRFNEAIAELQLSIAFNPGGNKAANLIEKVRKQKEAEHLVDRGENFMEAQKYFQAREAFSKALTLDPSNQRAQDALAQFKKEHTETAEGKSRKERFPIRSQSEKPVSFKFKKTSIINVFEVLSRLSGINFIFDKDVNDTRVTLFMTDVSYSDFIEALLDSNKLQGKMLDEKTILIYPDTPLKVKEYEDLKIRTFYLSHLEAKKMVGLLSKILKNRATIANDKMNAIVIRGSAEMLEIAERVIEANDRPSSEVLLNVEILEATRSREKQLGIEVNPSSITFGIGETAETISSDTTFAGIASGYALGEISRKEMLLSIPTAILHLLKKDGDTRTLANPQIRVKNNEKSVIHIGERVPLRSNRRVDTTGNVTYDFQYQDVGVKLEANPSINFHGEIVLDVSLEISTLGQNVGTADDPEYAINTRKAKSVLTVRDGEPIIIGGLIRDEDRETIQKIPYLGEIPIIGRLFTSLDKDRENTDILMSITPYLIYQQEIPGEEVTQIWSGKDDRFSTFAPYESHQNKMDGLLPVPRFPEAPAPELPEKMDAPPLANPLSGSREPDVEREALPEEAVDFDPEEESAGQGAESEFLIEDPVPETSVEDNFRAAADAALPEAYFWPDTVPFSIHVNSYSRKQQAEARARQLTALQYECFVVYADIPEKGGYYRVFVGRFAGFKAAKTAIENLRKKSEFDADIHAVNRKWAFGTG